MMDEVDDGGRGAPGLAWRTGGFRCREEKVKRDVGRLEGGLMGRGGCLGGTRLV